MRHRFAKEALVRRGGRNQLVNARMCQFQHSPLTTYTIFLLLIPQQISFERLHCMGQQTILCV